MKTVFYLFILVLASCSKNNDEYKKKYLCNKEIDFIQFGNKVNTLDTTFELTVCFTKNRCSIIDSMVKYDYSIRNAEITNNSFATIINNDRFRSINGKFFNQIDSLTYNKIIRLGMNTTFKVSCDCKSL